MSEDIKKLSAPMPEEAIQRTDKTVTKKGYDTTGYGYQYCVDRLNDVCGEKWGFEWKIIKESEGVYQKSGIDFFSITVRLSIWINDIGNNRACVGGHIGIDYADTLKGAITNAFKKTAAFWGIGGDAFRGTIDDDANLPDKHENIKSRKSSMKVCPICGVEAIITNKYEGNYSFLCWGKKGGCNRKFDSDMVEVIPEKKINGMTKEEALKKFETLPEKVKEVFKGEDYTNEMKWQFCNRHNWNHEKMISEIEYREHSHAENERAFVDDNISP